MHYKSNNPTREFLDLMFSALLTPQITIPTRLTVRSRTLIDNIFTNSVEKTLYQAILNVAFQITLHSFLSFRIKESYNKTIIQNIKKNYKNLDTNKFKNELQSIDWKTALSINNNDVNQSLENFLNISNLLLDKYAPLKQINKKQMKTNSRPWITKGILTSIRKKYKIHSKFLKAKDQTRKEALNQECKMYKNLLTNITKKSQENYYKQYFKF